MMDSSISVFMSRLALHGIAARREPTQAAATIDNSNNSINQQLAVKKEITATKTPITLQTLLPELRELIWEELLVSSTGYVRPIRSGTHKIEDGKKIKEYHFQPAEYDERFTLAKERINLSILFTTRQFYHETAHVFWSKNTFVLNALNPNDFPQVTTLDTEEWLATSFHRKMNKMLLDINLKQIVSDALDFRWGRGPRGATMECAPLNCLRTVLGILHAMIGSTNNSIHNEGALKSLTMKPIASTLCSDDMSNLVLLIQSPTISSWYRFTYFNEIVGALFVFNQSIASWERGSEGKRLQRKVHMDLFWDAHKPSPPQDIVDPKDIYTILPLGQSRASAICNTIASAMSGRDFDSYKADFASSVPSKSDKKWPVLVDGKWTFSGKHAWRKFLDLWDGVKTEAANSETV